jgi:DNA mismatch repair protein MutL
MAKVLVLPDHIASQIAAGEVVERPSSVVKELVENSIDAGATKIVVGVERGCRSIRVADNGIGMEAEDLSLAFQRHATSKLRCADDLWRLSTLGFRGEALPSIAAVSKITCFSRTADSAIGTLLESADGKFAVSETGCSPGTVIEVNELFFNVPARLSFLKKPQTEFAHIHETLQALAITYPGVSLELLHDGDRKLFTSGSNNLTLAIKEAGHFTGKETIIEIKDDDLQFNLTLEARLAGANHFRGDRKGILSIVNGRPVRCALAFRALDYAFADLIPRGRYPLAVTVLTLNATDLDVNIHPTKKEIKYAFGNDIYSFLQRNFIKALRSARSVSLYTDNNPLGQASPSTYTPVETEFAKLVAESGWATLPSSIPAIQSHLPLSSARSDSSSLRTVAAFNSKPFYEPSLQEADSQTDSAKGEAVALPLYFLIETANGLSLIEQHIAHERVLYERILCEKRQSKHQTDHLQKLIVSCPLDLSTEQTSLLSVQQEKLAAMGFEFEEKEGVFHCTQVPVELANKDYSKAVQEILQSLLESASPTIHLEIAKSLACQSAIKNGMPLSEAQIFELLTDWYNTPRNETCPHGRPIKLDFSKSKLFQMFHPA